MGGYAYDDWDVQLATQLMLEAIRAAVSEIDDDEEIPLGRMLQEIGEHLNVDTSQVNSNDSCTAAELRRRVRVGIEDLAHQERPGG